MSHRTTAATTALLYCAAPMLALILLAPSGAAKAWDPFLVKNRNVEEGNRALNEGDDQGALEAYERAARELPEEAGVQLNRGLALMEQERLDEAREALLRATEPGANADVRADAYYDMGLAFYRQGDAGAAAEDHQSAQAAFREAADAFRRSLRARPGNRDAAWNLELALRRIREQEEAQEQQEQEEQDQQDQQDQEDQEEQDQQDQEDQEQQDGEQDDQQQDQRDGEQDDQEQDQQEQQDGEQDDQQQDQGDGEQGDQEQEQESGDDARDPQDQQSGEQEDSQENPGEAENGGQELPQDVSRVLDALRDGEQSLERQRARARAQREGRRVTMDW